MHTPTLSVIVANFNNEIYIRDCLDSILNQTYKDLEIIVCDDCSSDRSLATIRAYAQQHPLIVNLISNPSNVGVAQARHLAILQATGEYLTTLDADDYYYETQKLEKEMELVLSHKEKTGRDIVGFSNIVLVEEDKTFIRIRGDVNNTGEGKISEGHIISKIMSRSCMIPRDFIMTRCMYFDVGGFDADIPIYEDWDLKIRLANLCEFYYSGVNGTAHRKHLNGLSAAPVAKHIEWMEMVFEKNLSLICDDDRECVTGQFKQLISRWKQRL